MVREAAVILMTRLRRLRLSSRFGLASAAASLLIGVFVVAQGSAYATKPGASEGRKRQGPQLLIGQDQDRIDNPDIQAGAGADQSLARTDVLEGGPDNDVIFGLNGNDMIDGGPGADI